MAVGDTGLPLGCRVLLCDLSIKVQLSIPSAKNCLFAPPWCTAGE